MPMSRLLHGRLLDVLAPIRTCPRVICSRPDERAEHRRLAAAGGAEQRDELAGFEREVDAVERALAGAVVLHDVDELDGGAALRRATRRRCGGDGVMA